MQSYFKIINWNIFLIFALCQCSKNLFRSTSDEKADSYRIDRARKEIDKENFDTALEYIVPVWERRQTEPEIAYIAANAYAGRAGLRIINLFDSLASDITTKTVLEIFSEHFIDASLQDVNDMESAIGCIENAGNRGALRNAKTNFFALLVYWARIGANLNYYAYAANNVKEAGFNACKISVNFGAATGLPQNIVDRIMVTVPRIIDTAAYVSGSGSDFDAILAANLPAEFSVLTSFDPIPCPGTTAPEIALCLGVRSVINLNTVGLNTGADCSGGTVP
ncbi:MAG: hypothetical protein KA116_01160 [Proteobacteria bacterium]|nr:hypothetical protein [Pseudomonadota bacterium]